MQNNFLSIALAAMKRGLYNEFIDFVPLDPEGKETIKGLPTSLLNLPRTEASVRLLAAVYPDSPVGIRGRRGLGGIFVLDIDQKGVIERIEREFGPFPKTYMTQTRPVSKPWKQHAIFWSTPLSVELFEKQRQCGEYDIKCCGGLGHIAAEGCCRPNGDGTFDTIRGNGLSILSIPDDLAKFLARDSRRLLEEKRVAHEAVRKEIARLNDGKEKRSQYLVPVGNRRWMLRSIAGTLINAMMPRHRVYRELLLQCKSGDYEGGVEFASSPEGRAAIKKIAYDPQLKPRPRTKPKMREYDDDGREQKSGLVVKQPSETVERKRRQQIIGGLPKKVTSAEAYAALDLDKGDKGDQQRFARLMRTGGFTLAEDRHSWIRLTTKVRQ